MSLQVGGSSPMHLQKAQIYIVEQEVCKNIYNGVKESIHETHICARDPNKQTGACNVSKNKIIHDL